MTNIMQMVMAISFSQWLCTHLFIRQWNVYKLVQTSRSEDGWVNDIRTVGSSNDKDVLFRAHPVHFSQYLVDHTVSSPTYGIKVCNIVCMSSLELLACTYKGLNKKIPTFKTQ